jgi:lactonase
LVSIGYNSDGSIITKFIWRETMSEKSVTTNLPLPPQEAALPQIKSEPWLQIDPGDVFLEGPAFDRQGNLLIMAAYDNRVNRRIVKISPIKKTSVIFQQKGVRLCGLAIHKDGRIFIACISGELLVMNPDGSNMTAITARYQNRPQVFNDLVFNPQGYLYATDFTGFAGNPTGGVYRFSPDMSVVEPVYQHITSANGVALAPDEKALWVTASHANEVFYLQLEDDGIHLRLASVPYRLTGNGGSDGMKVDQDGNVYLAINFQGRILVLNKNGFPIANVLMPGRDRGNLLRTTNLAFRPDSDEVFVTVSGEGGAWIYRFQALAKGKMLFSHR